MSLPRPLVWALTGVCGMRFAGFVTVGMLALVRGGPTHEHELFGAGLPKALAALLLGMAFSVALP